MFLLDYIYSTHPHHKFWIKDVPILPSPQSHIPRSAPPLIFPVSCFLSSSPQLTCPRHSSRGQSVFLCSYLSSNYHCLSLLNFALKKKATPSLFLIYLQPTALSPPYVLVAKPNICFSVWICCHLCGLWDGYSTLSQGGSFLPLLPHFLLRFSYCLIWPLFLWFFSKSSAPCRALRCWILKGLSSRYAFAWALLSNLWALVTSRVERPASLLQLNCPCRWATMPPSRAHPTGSSPWQPVLELTTPASWPNTWLVLDLFPPLLSYIASPPPLLLPGSAPLLLSSPPWRPANSFPAASDALPAYPSHCPQSDTLRKQHRPQHRPLPPKTSGASPYNNPGSSVCVCVFKAFKGQLTAFHFSNLTSYSISWEPDHSVWGLPFKHSLCCLTRGPFSHLFVFCLCCSLSLVSLVLFPI